MSLVKAGDPHDLYDMIWGILKHYQIHLILCVRLVVVIQILFQCGKKELLTRNLGVAIDDLGFSLRDFKEGRKE